MPCRRFECIHHTSFRAPNMPMCNYIIDTGKPRGCPAGRGCIRYTTHFAAKKDHVMRGGNDYKPKFNEPLAYKFYLDGKSDEEIAKEMNVTKNTIAHWRRKRDYPTNYIPSTQRMPPKAELMKHYEAGMLDKEIAEIYGVHKNSVFRWRQKYGLEANKMRMAAERIQNANG